MKYIGILLLASIADASNVDTTKPYVDLEINQDYGIPESKFFASKDFSGKPEIELNRKGLFIGDKKFCSFNGADELTDEVLTQMVFTLTKGDTDPCPQDNPVRSYLGDNGIGVSVISLQFEKIEGSTGIADYKGKKLYFDLKSIQGKYQLMKPKTKDQVARDNADKLKLINSKDFSTFRKGILKCLKDKDASCLKKYISNIVLAGVEDIPCAQTEWSRPEWEQKDLQPVAECILQNEMIVNNIKKCLTDEKLIEGMDEEGGTISGDNLSCSIQRKNINKGPWLLTSLYLGE